MSDIDESVDGGSIDGGVCGGCVSPHKSFVFWGVQSCLAVRLCVGVDVPCACVVVPVFVCCWRQCVVVSVFPRR